MELTDFVDPYLDPETGVLRNLVGARTQQELDAIEGDIVPVRELRLEENPPAPSHDLAELRSIHRFLFNAIYPWAGELRTVNMKKNLEGGSFFVPVSMIERASAYVAQELAEENFLKGLTREAFVARLAYHYDQLNTGGGALFQRELFLSSRGVTNFSPLLTQVACVHSFEQRSPTVLPPIPCVEGLLHAQFRTPQPDRLA